MTRLLAAPIAALALLLPAGAGGLPGDTYSATSSPPVVQASSTHSYTVEIANDAASAGLAARARVGIPAGFTLTGTPATASTTAADTCAAATWEPDGPLFADGRLNLRSPAPGNELCPGGTLTVSFSAVAPATDGVYTWATELLDADSFALTGSQPTVTVDGTAPDTTIDSGPADPTNETGAVFTFSSSEGSSTFECRLDAAAFGGCTSPTTLSDLTEGSHTFEVRATDAAGNRDLSPDLHAWGVDRTPPQTSIDTAPPDPTNGRAPSFEFSASEAASFECALDGAAFAECVSPKGYSSLQDGSHTFEVRRRTRPGTSIPLLPCTPGASTPIRRRRRSTPVRAER